MKNLGCADLGMKECTFKASGNTNKEVIDRLLKHGQSRHKEKLEKMTEKSKKNMMASMNRMLDKLN